MSNLRNCVSGDPTFVALWHSICDEAEKSEAEWVTGLRAQGVKAAHPDDGWVDRKENSVKFVYPQFDDSPEVGDLIALGWHGGPPKYKSLRYRIVRVTAIRRDGYHVSNRVEFSKCYFFEPVESAQLGGSK